LLIILVDVSKHASHFRPPFLLLVPSHLSESRSPDHHSLLVAPFIHCSLRACPQYIPAPKELVLGTIIARHAEGYRVDIGSAQMATLDALAFEGATKRSKPNLKVSGYVTSHFNGE